MRKTVLLVLAGVSAALGIAFVLQPSSKPFVEAEAARGNASAAPPEASVGSEEARFEETFAAEVDRHVALERASNPLDVPFIDPARRDGAGTVQDQRLAVDLIVAGFAADRAEWISRRVQELRVEAQYEAGREGRASTADFDAPTLRMELGDQDYERFLVARGVPTSVKIMRVFPKSPAERAGMQRGDEIFSYDGKRVFNARELNELAFDGTSGESAVVDVRRGGEYFRFVLPRGWIGVRDGSDPSGPRPGFER